MIISLIFIVLIGAFLITILISPRRRRSLLYHRPSPVLASKKKIILIFTGGTIAGVVDPGTNSIKASTFKKNFFRRIPHKRRLDSIASWRNPPKTATILLSEQMSPKDWRNIAGAIANEINESDVDGIVVAHGTDTMPFTASAVSFILNKIPSIPVIFTGSLSPFSQRGSDAPQNLSDSILAAAHKDLAGVFIVFPSKDGRTRDIHLAVRTQPMSLYRNYFKSIDQKPIGCVENGKISLDRKFPVSYEKTKVRISPHVDSNIEYHRIFPGFNVARTLDRLVDSNNNQIRAVLLELYHSGTGCTRDIAKEYDLKKYISVLNEKGILVFGIPKPQKMYNTSLELENAGLIFLERMSVPAAITKLMWVLGRYQSNAQALEIKQKMSENLRHEIADNSKQFSR